MTALTPDICRGRAIKALPELAGANFRMLGEGFDSVALLADGRLVLKFPKHAAALAALRREAAVLDAVRPALDMRVPDMGIIEAPHPFSRHRLIPGAQLLPDIYDALDLAARRCLAERLAGFQAALHALPAATLHRAGPRPVAPWLPLDRIRRDALPLLSAALRARAADALNRFASLAADPLGQVFGHFDAHGWNMAFDVERAELNGIYDFADSGIGPLHRDFVCSSLISPDLTDRVMLAYEAQTGRSLDRDRIWLLTAAARLSDLAEIAPGAPLQALALRHVTQWLASR